MNYIFNIYIKINNIMANELDYLKIYKEHLIKTGFSENFNKFIDIAIYSIEYLVDQQILRYKTNISEIDIPFNISLGNLSNVETSNATSGSILVYNGSEWIAQNQSDALNYTRTEQSTRFTDIKNVSSVYDALDAILYPYQEPTFSNFYISNKATILELGQELSSVSDMFTFVWATTNSQNISDTGYNILDVTGSKTLATSIDTTSSMVNIDIDYQILSNSISSYIFQINTQNTNNDTFSKNYTISWRPRMFWGYSPDSSLTSTTIRDLQNSNLVLSANGTYNIDGNGEYIYFVVPQSFGSLIDEDGSNSRFLVGNLPNSSFVRVSINYVNTYNHTEAYYVYRTSTVQYGQNIEIKIT